MVSLLTIHVALFNRFHFSVHLLICVVTVFIPSHTFTRFYGSPSHMNATVLSGPLPVVRPAVVHEVHADASREPLKPDRHGADDAQTSRLNQLRKTSLDQSPDVHPEKFLSPSRKALLQNLVRMTHNGRLAIAAPEDETALLSQQMGDASATQARMQNAGIIRALGDGLFLWGASGLVLEGLSQWLTKRQADMLTSRAARYTSFANALAAQPAPLDANNLFAEYNTGTQTNRFRFYHEAKWKDLKTRYESMNSGLLNASQAQGLLHEMAGLFHAESEAALGMPRRFPWAPVFMGVAISGVEALNARLLAKKAKARQEQINIRNSLVLAKSGYDMTLARARHRYTELFTRVPDFQAPSRPNSPDSTP
jgi:hypothetical protein